ncbi:hypothetical protein Rctr85_057 [Virus Rctr85]|nr:hypothetical protein Rctr85_057 [Virus Rctr85]
MNATQKHILAKRLVEQHVIQNQTVLVDRLFSDCTVDLCDVNNLRQPIDHAILRQQYPREHREWCTERRKQEFDGTFAEYLEQECKIESFDEREVMSWWVVSDWLLTRLEAAGQPVLDLPSYGRWWGRTGVGAAVVDDDVIVQIAQKTKVAVPEGTAT